MLSQLHNSEKLLRKFYITQQVKQEKGNYYIAFDPNTVQGQRLEFDLVDPKTGDVLGKEGKKLVKLFANVWKRQELSF